MVAKKCLPIAKGTCRRFSTSVQWDRLTRYLKLLLRLKALSPALDAESVTIHEGNRKRKLRSQNIRIQDPQVNLPLIHKVPSKLIHKSPVPSRDENSSPRKIPTSNDNRDAKTRNESSRIRRIVAPFKCRTVHARPIICFVSITFSSPYGGYIILLI